MSHIDVGSGAGMAGSPMSREDGGLHPCPDFSQAQLVVGRPVMLRRMQEQSASIDGDIPNKHDGGGSLSRKTRCNRL